jgi:hypothetical protein
MAAHPWYQAEHLSSTPWSIGLGYFSIACLGGSPASTATEQRIMKEADATHAS